MDKSLSISICLKLVQDRISIRGKGLLKALYELESYFFVFGSWSGLRISADLVSALADSLAFRTDKC